MLVRGAITACAVTLGAAGADAQVIKLGTVAPEGSPWHNALMEMAQQWKEISGGKVTVRIYAGGVAGDEKDMLRKIRIGQLHATALTTTTLLELDPDIEVLAFPMLVRTDEQLDYLIEKIGPRFEKSLEQNGLKVLNWSTAGWVHFFAKAPVITPADMRQRRFFFWGNDAAYIDLMKSSGFNPVPLSITDLLPSLQTGLVDAFAAPPAAALSFQWFGAAPHMTGMRYMPLPGVSVVSTRQWNAIPADLRPQLEAAAREIGQGMLVKIRALESEAVEAMKKRGLTVHEVPAGVVQDWESLVREKGESFFVGKRFSKEIYDRVRMLLREVPSESAAPLP